MRFDADRPREIAPTRGGYVSNVGRKPGRSAHDLYRYGERGVLTRYIIPPTRGLFCCGWTVADTLTVLAIAPILYGWLLLVTAAFAPIA